MQKLPHTGNRPVHDHEQKNSLLIHVPAFSFQKEGNEPKVCPSLDQSSLLFAVEPNNLMEMKLTTQGTENRNPNAKPKPTQPNDHKHHQQQQQQQLQEEDEEVPSPIPNEH